MKVTFRLSMHLTDPEGKTVQTYHYEIGVPDPAQARRVHLEKHVLPQALHRLIEMAVAEERDLPPWLLAR